MADADGRETRRLTTFGEGLREPLWSPDGRHIAFHSRREGGRNQIYVVDLDPAEVMARSREAVPTNALHQIVKTPFDVVGPQWAADGQSLFVLRGNPGRLMRVHSTGGELEDLFESRSARVHPSGRRIYYQKPNQTNLYTRSLEGDVRSNLEERVLTDIYTTAGFVITEDGIFYSGLDKAGNPSAIRFFDFSLKRTFDLAPAPTELFLTLRASPDRQRLLYDTTAQSSGNLMLMQLRRKKP
jgi:Tol biopolymer transport system component